MRSHWYAGEGFPFSEAQLSVTLAPTVGLPCSWQAGEAGGTAGTDVSPEGHRDKGGEGVSVRRATSGALPRTVRLMTPTFLPVPLSSSTTLTVHMYWPESCSRVALMKTEMLWVRTGYRNPTRGFRSVSSTFTIPSR